MENMQVVAGLLPAPPPPPKQLTPAEQLEATVILNYNGGLVDGKKVAPLSADKMRERCRVDRAYRETYNRLAETDKLETRITRSFTGAEIGG